ncbi:MAG: hypothetical protein KIT43_07810 [Bauldia sp.]|nr:hypothetical protein [Bauldia sp.]
MITRKVRRLTIRVKNRGHRSGRDREIGVTTVVAARSSPAAKNATRPARPQRRRETILVEADGGEGVAKADAGRTAPIERLVAEARERVLLLSRKSGGGVAQASVLGRLAATGEISRRQHQAGARYAGIVREHDALLSRNAPQGAGGPVPGTGIAEGDEAEARTRYRTAMARYDRCRAALRDAGREDRMAAAVVDAVTVNNWELPELTPALRIGLNHIARTLDAMDGTTDAAGARPEAPR